MGRESETKVQFTFETRRDYWKNEWKRARGKLLDYVWFKFRWKYYPKMRIVPTFPLNVDIEVSSVCNLKCDHCFRQYMDIGEKGLMPSDMYRKIVDECAAHGLFTLKFSMRGEPTLHPELPEMVEYAKQRGIKEVWINTHGGNITTDLADRLMKARPDWITVSFDGLGKMYESIRKPLKYEESLEKLRILRRARDNHSMRTLLNVQTLWSAISDDPEAYVRIMTEIVDRVAFNSDMNFDQIILIPDDRFVCPRLWQRIAITSNGDFLKCPSDFKKQEVLANIKDHSIKEVWDIMQGANRQQHLDLNKSLSSVCNECHHGAKKVKRQMEVGERDIDSFNFSYREDFHGVGLHRKTDKPSEGKDAPTSARS